jgi:geranylgeranyl diphosphate synthase type I
MLNDETASFERLLLLMEERSQNVRKRFRETLTSNVTNLELLSILDGVKGYKADIVRTSIASFSCEAVGGQPENVEDASLMFALASAGIGIHDDIIDKTSKKHFDRTLFSLHDFEEALLVGDLLIVKGLMAIHEMVKKPHSPTKIVNVIKVYDDALIQMCEAEFMGLTCRGRIDLDVETYEKILWKINADIEACAKIGAILGEASANEIVALSEFGRRLGFMFTLTDDLRDSLNIEGNIFQRLKFESVPLPLLYAAKASRNNSTKTELILKKPRITQSDVKQLWQFCTETDAFAYMKKLAQENRTKAIQQLHLLRVSSARNSLELMLESSLDHIVKLCKITAASAKNTS